jgi:hypothetical protein
MSLPEQTTDKKRIQPPEPFDLNGAPTSDETFIFHRQHLKAAHGNKKMGRAGFEPAKAEPADLQSAPFGHSGTHPRF